MADIRLVRPEAGTNQAVACAPEAKFVFDFPTDAATLSRNGDNLVMTFEDGATLTLTDFYKAYSSKNMPSFEVDGAQVAGADFFAAMNEPDLMPAAGPGGRGAAGVGGARYHEYANMALYDGLDRLDGLDVGWPDGGYEPEIDGAAGRVGDDDGGYLLAGIPDGIPSITPDGPGAELTPDPDNPEIPTIPTPNIPGGPATPSTGRDVLTVSETNLLGSANQNPGMNPEHHKLTAKGSMHVESPDGVDSIVVGGEVVYENGQFTPTDIHTDEGTLHVTGFDPETGELTYEYTLERSSTEHDENKNVGADNSFARDIPVTVTDPDGDSASSTITVVVEDDAPKAESDTVNMREGQTVSGDVLTGKATLDETSIKTGSSDKYGADGRGTFDDETSVVKWDVEKLEEKGYTVSDPDAKGNITVQTPYGDLTLRPDGTYEFTAKEDADLAPNQHKDIKVGYTITDADGDEKSTDLTIKLRGDNHIPEIGTDIPTPSDEDATSGTENGHIVVDEWDNPAKDNYTDHSFHGQKGMGSFNVQLNGESGTVTLTDKYGHTVKMHIKEDGTYTLTDENGNELTGDVTLQVNGVNVTLTPNTGNLENTDDGSWKVPYSYELSGPQQHAKDNTNGDTTVTGEEITITVTDASGDTATGKLTSEVHDDVPEMSVAQDSATDTASVTVDMGADADDVYENADATVEVFAQNAEGNPTGTAFEWTNNDDPNQKTTDLTEMKDGDTWTSGDVTVHKYGDRYEFTNHNEDEGKNLTVKATDADGDTVQDEVHLGEAKTDITVGTQDKDTLTPGDPSYPGDPSDPGSPDDPGNPSFESPNDTGANDFVIGDIYAQQNAGNVGNFAFLVDTSSSLSTDDLAKMIDSLQTAIQSIIDALKENGGSADILVADFNIVTRHAYTFQLTGDSDVNDIFGNGTKSLVDILNEFKIGGEIDNLREGYYNDMYTALGTTNYEAAMELAEQWFNSLQGNPDKNQTFVITDGVPTASIEDNVWNDTLKSSTYYNTSIGFNGQQLNEELKNVEWVPGQETTITVNGKTIYIDSSGVLYLNKEHTDLLLGEDTASSNCLGAKATPLVLQAAENGGYEAHRVGGYLSTKKMDTEAGQSKEALDELSEVSDVVILGVGNSFKNTVNKEGTSGAKTGKQILEEMGKDNNKVTTQTDLDFGNISDEIQKSLKALDPASDLLIGGKGNDILFGDRVDYYTEEQYSTHDAATEVTQNALFAMAAEVAGKLGVTAPTNNLADLAGFIREHAKDFGDTLDAKFMDKSGGSDVLIGGTGHDVLYGQGGDDLLIGDGGEKYLSDQDELSVFLTGLRQTGADPTDSLKKLDEFEDAGTAHGDDLLFGGSGNDILLGGAGNDKLFGGNGEDILYGGTGNDYLDGGEGGDYLYGGAGDDLIVYDESDYAVFGGDGIDVLLSNGTNDTLSDLNGEGGKPHVNGVEVFLKGDETHKDARGFDVEDLTSLSDLAKKAGITITDTDGDGNGDRLTLGQGWMKGEASNTYVNDELGLTVELQNMEQVDPDTEQLVFQLQNTNS